MKKAIITSLVITVLSIGCQAAVCGPVDASCDFPELIPDSIAPCDTVVADQPIIVGESRSDIENQFIEGALKFDRQREMPSYLDLTQTEPYAERYFVLPGATYQNKNISQNIYLESDSVASPLWDENSPLESIANLFIYPDQKYGSQICRITVLKHEIGNQTTFSVPVASLIGYSEESGCQPFFGVEKYENDTLEGALFLFNPTQGYDHIFKVVCQPKSVIAGVGEIELRASLFVPTDNVSDLFAPHRPKSANQENE